MNRFLLLFAVLILISCTEPTRFRLLSSRESGIDFINTIIESDTFHVISYEYIYNGAGVGIGDLNNDGLQDLVFSGNQVSPRIYLNMSNFKFRDITANFEGLSNDQWYSGVAIVDINSDGWLDIYITSTAGNDPQKCKNRLWINNGANEGNDPTFTEMAEKYGIAEDGQSVSAAFLDYDCDGDLDLYIINNIFNDKVPPRYRQKIVDGSAVNNDKLYRNNGDGTFTDVTIEAGIVFEGYALGLAVGDVNKDGFPDIYVSNDYIANDLLYINQGDGTFKNEIRKYMSYQTKSSMGNDMADVNNDGNPDMFTLDMLPEHYHRKRQTINGFGYIYYINDEKYDYEHQYIRNMLHLHNGFIDGEMLPYSEVGQMMGIYDTEWSWSPLFADYDNDGDKDLIIANGYPRDLTDKDWTFQKMRTFEAFYTAKEVIEKAPVVKVPNFAFENTGNYTFIRQKKKWLPPIPSYSNGAAFADLDNDGDLDYVTNNLNDEAFVYRNYTMERSGRKANYLKIKLIGKTGNTMALGAKVELWTNGKYQFNEHFITRGYASSVDPVIHFGISNNTLIDSVKITWPARGKITVKRNLIANQTIVINESVSAESEKDMESTRRKNFLFKKADNIVDYSHRQTDFIDFALNQKIIPHKFSQIGPCMAKGDIDGDGVEDLIIGSTNTLPTTVFLRRGDLFEEAKFEGLTTYKEFSESGLAVLDIEGDGDNDIIAITGGYENPGEDEYRHYLYENNNGIFTRINLPLPSFPASVVRPFDFDHDGDIDLFIAARIKKGRFPYADNSWLIINESGSLTTGISNGFDLGMVTDAIWSDYDGDGWEDLIIAREWNSLAVLKNNQGKELILQNIPELESRHGIWYSLAAGDFDLDGDDDYIVGNLGDNHRFTVNDIYPLNLYVIDLDLDDNIDPVITAYWKDQNDKMKEYPVNYRDELSAQTSFFRTTFSDYTSFSYATIHDIIYEDIFKRLESKLKVNTTSSYILWNDRDRFRWEKLPRSLQVSPVKKMIVHDLNNDGYPDVITAGNDHTYDVGTGYYDADKGMILLNNKNASFEVVPPSESGMLLQGMVESLIWFSGDKPLVVAGINRGKTLVYEYKPPIPF